MANTQMDDKSNNNNWNIMSNILNTNMMKKDTTMQKKIRTAIEEQAENLIIPIWNEYCDYQKCGEDRIYENDVDEFDRIFEKPSEIVARIVCGDYHLTHEYWVFNGYGNIVSFNFLGDENSPYDDDELVENIASNFHLYREYFPELDEDDED